MNKPELDECKKITFVPTEKMTKYEKKIFVNYEFYGGYWMFATENPNVWTTHQERRDDMKSEK